MEERPWGYFITLYEAPRYKVKLITVNPGERLSLQYHKYRDEHWYVVSGVGNMRLNGKLYCLYAGDSIDIPIEWEYRVGNDQAVPLVFVEVQTGKCDEDDIIRKEDDYNRVSEYNGMGFD